MGDNLAQAFCQCRLRYRDHLGADRYQVGTRWQCAESIEIDEGGAKAASAAIAADGRCGALRDGKGHFGCIGVGRYVHNDEPPPTNPHPLRPQSSKGLASTDALDHADRRARPLRRRARSTLRPAFVDIRLRKPCFFERLRTFGW